MTTTQGQMDSLCDTCSSINFLEYFQQAIHYRTDRNEFIGPTQDAIRLGDFEDILEKSGRCSFCRIVVKALCHRRCYSYRRPQAVLQNSRMTGQPLQCWMYSYPFAESPGQDSFRIAISTFMPRGPWFPPECHAGDIQLLVEDVSSTNGNARFKGRRVGQVFDVNMARLWLRTCEEDHGELCSNRDGDSKGAATPRDMLVIDVKELCLCDYPVGARYIALSYCWPATPGLTTSSATVAELKTPGCLKNQLDLLPLTIQDAITFVTKMGEKYLWVDALCIIQDSEEHKQTQILRMDSIYAESVLTIVAAYQVPPGEPEPCRGLPGLRPTTRDADQHTEAVGDVSLAVPFDSLDNMLRLSRWDTRAWTFQERLLSRRCLFFMGEQAFFQCGACTFCEDSVGEQAWAQTNFYRGTNLWNSIGAQVVRDNHGWAGQLTRQPYPDAQRAVRAFEDLAANYGGRALSDPRDILNAFQGVQNVLEAAMATHFWFGVPERFLDNCLLWTFTGAPRRRTQPVYHHTADGGQPAEAVYAPSWSWVGWRTPVEFGTYFYTTKCVCEVPWFAISRRGDQALFLHVESFFASTPLGPANRIVRPHEPPPDDFLATVVLRKSVVNLASDPNWRFPRHLACQTAVATFTLIVSEVRHLGQHGRMWPHGNHMALFDARRRWVGSMMLDRAWLADNVPGCREFDFILLSRVESMASLVAATQFQPAYFDRACFEERSYCLLNVMMIERRADNVAQRLGVALVHEDAWVEAGPRPEFVKLE